MDLRWTEEAATNLEGIADYIGRENPAMATRVANTIHDYVADQLTQFPEIGRPGRGSGTLELVGPSLPFIAGYRITDRTVQILAILHTRRSWPDDFNH